MPDSFAHLVQLMAKLRAPDGCPWDRKQTHDSLKPYLIEEAYEVLEAIDRRDMASLREELGDLALQILFHAQIGSETGAFTIDEVLERLAAKLVRRHPHVFAESGEGGEPGSPEEVVTRWEEIKRRERRQAGAEAGPASVLSGVPKILPALLRAYQVQARASRVGFDWPHTRQGRDQVIEKIEEEVRELRAAEDQGRIEAEFGDLLFALVNLGRFLKVNPEEALRQATNRFTERFQYVEQAAARRGQPLDKMSLEEMDALWKEAKKHLAARHP